MSPRIILALVLGLSRLGAQELIHPVSVSSSTAGTDFFAVGHLIDGSGLPGIPDLSNYASLEHQPASSATAWVTTDSGTDYFASTAPDPVLTLSLSEIHDLTDFVLWGYHFGSPNNNEAKSFTLEFSTDGGQNFSGNVQLVHNRTAAQSDTLSLGGTYSADTIRITITDNHRDEPGAGGGDRVGLGEIRFIGAPKPYLAPILSAPPNFDFGSHTTDPGPLQTSLTMTNSGIDEILQITDVRIRAGTPGASYFSVTGAPVSMTAGQTAPLTVDFYAAGNDGCFTALLDITSNDPESPLTTVVLTASVNCTPSPPVEPDFSPASQTFDGTLAVTLSTVTIGGYIVYTTDGSLPTAENGTVYDGPISISETTQIRAAAIVPGQEPAVATESYLRLAADMQSYQSELPILVIDNFAAGTIPNKAWSTSSQTGAGLVQPDRQPAAMLVFDRDAQSRIASVSNSPDLRSRIGIRVRGAFSSTWTPRPYSIETWKRDSDDDRKVSPLGMPSESDWILYFPHPTYDSTMLKNTFIWELSSRTGRYGTRFRFVDVFVNENGGDISLADRKGVYALAEKVKRDPRRIDYEALSEDGSTGGWLLSINRMDAIPASGYPTENGATSPQFFHTAGPNRLQETAPNTAGSGDDIPRQYNAFINFEDPNGYRINAPQRNAVEDWFRAFEDVFYDDNIWLDPINGYRNHLDTRDFIDYFHLLNLGKQGDGLLLSMYPWVSSGERKLHMGPMWDFNNGAFAGTATGTLYFREDRLWYPRLFADPTYLREHIDRWYELRRGPLSDQAMSGLVDEQAARIPDSLVPAQGITLATWQSRISEMKSWLGTRANWIDDQWLKPPALALNGTTLNITHQTAGSLYYTTDGSDPLDSSTAILFQTPISLSVSVHIRTRLQTGGGEWSAINEDTYRFGTPADASNLVLSEIMYHPAEPEAGAEFIELQNIHPAETIDLTNVRFTAGITYAFPVGTALAPGERVVVLQSGFENDTRLANSGEQIVLTAEDGSPIRDFTYDDRTPWPEAADGDGFSLVLIAPDTNPDHAQPTSWRRSSTLGGNPGSSDTLSYTPGTSLLDYALTNPRNFSVSTNASPSITLTVPIDRAAEDATVTIEQSADLAVWTPVVSPSILSAVETHEIWLIPSAASARYFRIRVDK